MALVTGIQFTLWLWKMFPVRDVGQGTRDRLTEWGLGWFRPEHDLPIYALGMLLTLALAIAVNAVWSRRPDPPGTAAGQRGPMHSMTWLQVPVAAGLSLLPMLSPRSTLPSLAAVLLGLLFCFLPVVAPEVLKLRLPGGARKSGAARYAAESAVVLLTILLLVYVPDVSSIATLSCIEDHFHHWDIYAMAPALAFRHGGALGTDIYVQYSLGWPMVLAFLSGFTPLSYKLGVHVGNLWACFYFAGLYLFLRVLTGRARWAMPGLLLAILLQMYTGVGPLPKWVWPSSTVMRYPFDVLAFLVCLRIARTGRARLGVLLGMLAGLAILFGTDTGIYLLACIAAYSSALRVAGASGSIPREARASTGWALLGLALVLPAGLAIASRGTLLRPEFWSGWFEALISFPGGIGQLPIRDAGVDGRAHLLLTLMLVTYLFTLLRGLEQLSRKALDATALTCGTVALYGLATLLLFIARSHAFNLHHVCIPFCILVIAGLASAQREALERIDHETSGATKSLLRLGLEVAPVALAGLLLIGLTTDGEARVYPSLLRSVLASEPNPARVPPFQYLFASREDVALPPSYQEEIATFRATADAVRSLSDGGRHTVALVGQADSPCLLEADVGPYFRYCPLFDNLLWKEQVESIARILRSNPPEFLVMTREDRMRQSDFAAPYRALAGVIRDRFELQKSVGSVDILKYRPAPPDRR